MSDLAIQVDNVSKRYQLGTIGTGSLRRDLYQWWRTRIRNDADPFALETKLPDSATTDPSFIWALKNVSFEAKQGEVWGLVGGNGSGKSTLLKIISRIVRPTHGAVRGKGRLSSLLEVGAGFHDDLTGRENVYLSGYILGMKRHEIKRRFDEIVEFSGVDQFIDTPVKRYSSGMYVRLAFAVAAHLDADVMIVDEVLAVGDADFQKKCLNKMQAFARNDGRTILFVSHNLQAVTHLCQNAIWLQRGQVMATGPVQSITSQYMNQAQINHCRQTWSSPAEAPGNDIIRIRSVELQPQSTDIAGLIDVRTPLTIKFQLWVLENELSMLVGIRLFTYDEQCVFDVISPCLTSRRGRVEGDCTIPGCFLNNGTYSVALVIFRDNWEEIYHYPDCLLFEVHDYREQGMNFGDEWMGVVRPQFPIRLVQLAEQEMTISTPLI